MFRFVSLLLLVLVIEGLTSCRSFTGRGAQENVPPSPTSKRTLPSDAVTFDALLIQVPYHERDLIQQLWKEVDEQEVGREERSRLNENGFRMGIIGASLPPSLSTLLTLKGRPLRSTLEEETSLTPDESGPTVASKSVTLQAGNKSLIDIWGDDVVANIPVLKNENGELLGKSYSDARTLVTVSIRPNSDGSVQFEMIPFLRYGDPEMVTRYQRAQLVRTQEQPTKTFDQVRSRLNLRPGQFLVMGAYDEFHPGLGHYFFTRGTEDIRQKLLIIRLLVTQHDSQFSRFPGFGELTRMAEKEEDR